MDISVNDTIARWLEQTDIEVTADLRANIRAAANAIPVQAPAAYRFEWRQEKIAAVPPDPHPDPGGVAQSLLDETRAMAERLAHRLEQTRSHHHVVRTVRGLIDVLPSSIGDLRPGLLWAQGRALAADAIAFGRDEDTELFPDATTMIRALSGTASRLEACFPELREIEAELRMQNLTPVDPIEVKENLFGLTRVATEDPAASAVVDESALDALKTMVGIADEFASSDMRSELVAEVMVVRRNFLSPVIQVLIADALMRELGSAAAQAWAKAKPEVMGALAVSAKPSVVATAARLVVSLLGPIDAPTILGRHKRLDRLEGIAPTATEDRRDEYLMSDQFAHAIWRQAQRAKTDVIKDLREKGVKLAFQSRDGPVEFTS